MVYAKVETAVGNAGGKEKEPWMNTAVAFFTYLSYTLMYLVRVLDTVLEYSDYFGNLLR